VTLPNFKHVKKATMAPTTEAIMRRYGLAQGRRTSGWPGPPPIVWLPKWPETTPWSSATRCYMPRTAAQTDTTQRRDADFRHNLRELRAAMKAAEGDGVSTYAGYREGCTCFRVEAIVSYATAEDLKIGTASEAEIKVSAIRPSCHHHDLMYCLTPRTDDPILDCFDWWSGDPVSNDYGHFKSSVLDGDLVHALWPDVTGIDYCTIQ
jgi:hypothetical protein